MTELHEMSALDQWLALQRGEFSPLELTGHYLQRIERLNPELGAFVTVTADAARRRARNLEAVVSRTSPLWGLPIAEKDLTSRRGVQTGYGSRAFTGTIAARSDEIVEVLDGAGAVSLGKTNTPEFGMYGFTESSVAPPARNPWNLELGAGGSSGGAAAAVAARLLPFAPGSDGGGSIRIPAAACGLVGIKPSRGLVPSGSGIDSIGGLAVKGPIARSVTDAALLLDAMIARRNGRIDHHFALRAPDENDGDLLGAAVRGEGRFNIGVLRNSPFDDARDIKIAPEASAALDIALGQLSRMGHGMEDVVLAHGGVYPDAFRKLWQISAAGIPVDDANLGLLEPVTAELVRAGRALGAWDVTETLGILNGFERSVIAQFSRFDVVISPALGQVPQPVGSYDLEDPDTNFWQQVDYSPFTSFVNVAGLPALTLPVSETADALPMGVQLIGRPGGESTLLSVGAQLERRIRWQHRSPALASR
ncbi:amidase [Okibacterium sp. HSC-33S16]|uniref:amidase n=1 Tax=Okibacterium sp. HSC-33S16 TaxID=2910965 RepID=UPI0020A1858D|nr:amidase [Okibacterium sp. HSC-33S16]MCP2031768.1 amidase [Okibacterium sp. HSC-33S16]